MRYPPALLLMDSLITTFSSCKETTSSRMSAAAASATASVAIRGTYGARGFSGGGPPLAAPPSALLESSGLLPCISHMAVKALVSSTFADLITLTLRPAQHQNCTAGMQCSSLLLNQTGA